MIGRLQSGFTLVEVVLAMGIVSFSVLATVGLLSVANDTNKKSRDEAFAAQLAANEFERIRSLGEGNFPRTIYLPRYFDSNLGEITKGNPAQDPRSVYKFAIDIKPAASPQPAGTPASGDQLIFNATVSYPASAPSPTNVLFTTVMVVPFPTPTPTPTPTPGP